MLDTANDNREADARKYGIEPQEIFRRNRGPELFGISAKAIIRGIRDGTIPTPIPLTSHDRTTCWVGWQVIAWMKQREKEARKRAMRII